MTRNRAFHMLRVAAWRNLKPHTQLGVIEKGPGGMGCKRKSKRSLQGLGLPLRTHQLNDWKAHRHALSQPPRTPFPGVKDTQKSSQAWSPGKRKKKGAFLKFGKWIREFLYFPFEHHTKKGTRFRFDRKVLIETTKR